MPPSIRPFLADQDSPRIAQLMRDYGFPCGRGQCRLLKTFST